MRVWATLMLAVGTVTVRLTATGVPVPAVQRLEVYVTEIAASTESRGDSAPREWAVLARPDRAFDVPMLTDGGVSLGQGLVPVGAYAVIRVTIDGPASKVWLADGRLARVRWPAGETVPVLATAGHPIEVWSEDTEILVELNVSQSFTTLLADPLHDLVFTPVARVAGPARARPLVDSILEVP